MDKWMKQIRTAYKTIGCTVRKCPAGFKVITTDRPSEVHHVYDDEFELRDAARRLFNRSFF